ncbi:MAG: hypothetical protein UR31_C0036G0009 [Parcubacteria group bacterium GW2011_GWA2_33_14]|nr:MAG: hypothetical protein UR31_C0036G0009 [Parcubacteria group bacterium GW2011_GWA2_33_14]
MRESIFQISQPRDLGHRLIRTNYVAQCLNVDVSSFGNTKKEALVNLQEALVLYFEDNKSVKKSKIEHPELVDLMLSHA